MGEKEGQEEVVVVKMKYYIAEMLLKRKGDKLTLPSLRYRLKLSIPFNKRRLEEILTSDKETINLKKKFSNKYGIEIKEIKLIETSKFGYKLASSYGIEDVTKEALNYAKNYSDKRLKNEK